MSKFIKEYIEDNDIQIQYQGFTVPKKDMIPMPYTNFFVIDADYFRQRADVLHFLAQTESGTYASRWGDAPIWGAVFGLFLHVSQAILVPLNYRHGSWFTTASIDFQPQTQIYREDHRFGLCGFFGKLNEGVIMDEPTVNDPMLGGKLLYDLTRVRDIARLNVLQKLKSGRSDSFRPP